MARDTVDSAVMAARVGEVMSTKLVTIGPTEGLQFAHHLMMWSNVRHLPVLDDGALVGVLADRQLLAAILAEDGSERRVRDIMTAPEHSASPNDDLGEAAARMALGRLDALPVITEGKLVGILTTTDVLAERGKLFFHGGKVEVPDVARVMRREVHTAFITDGLAAAIGTMVEEGIRHLPVLDSEGRIAGLLTDRDVRAAVGDPLEALRSGGVPDVTLEEVMNRAPLVIAADASIADLAACFLDDRVGALPVVDDDDRVVGIVSYVDLLQHAVATHSR